jgi:putative two-component system response regulator
MSSTITFPQAGPGARILVVDDEEPVRRSLVRVLERAGYQCAAAADAAEAKHQLARGTFALMLSDGTMPGESGFSLLVHARSLYPDLAVIMVTAVSSPAATEVAARHGAAGYVVKPFDTNVLLIKVVSALRERAERLAVAEQARQGNDMAGRQAELEATVERLAAEDRAGLPREETVRHAALSAEWRDPDIAAHLSRMSALAARLATLAGFTAGEVERLRLAAQLHDIGKGGIPEAILRKTTPLSAEERLTMEGHTEKGFKMLERYDTPLLRLGAMIALSHHERFDGSGYPHRLAGGDIPLEGRIVAVADVYDALRGRRPYKQPYSRAEAIGVLRDRRRTQLDPALLDLFIDDLEAGTPD